MTTSGCNLSCQVRPQTFSGENSLGLARRSGRLRGAEWPNLNISQHIQKNVNGASCEAYFRLVQVQAQCEHLKDVIYHCCGCVGGMCLSRALFRMTVSWNAAQYQLLYR